MTTLSLSSYISTAATVSIREPTITVAEDDETVEICATLSISSGNAIANDITVTLATSDATPGKAHISYANFATLFTDTLLTTNTVLD